MKKKLLIILAVLIVLYLIGKGCSSTSNTDINQNATDTHTAQEPAKQTDNNLPENKFDANVAIPGTKLAFAYPAKGFYEKGAVVKTFQPGDPDQYGHVLTIQAEQKFEKEFAAQFLTVIVSLGDTTADDQTLQAVVDGLDQTSLETDAIKANGHYQTINGHEFFLFKVDDVIAFWRGITVYDNQVIVVTLMYNPDGGAQSKATATANDSLFLEILNHISYK